MTSPSVRGHVVIVTGGGRGLGRAYALDLASRGARVIVNDISKDGQLAEEVAREIRSSGGEAFSSADSVADLDGAKAIVDKAVSGYGIIHAVIHNAGFSASGPFEELADEALQHLFGVHVFGAFNVLRPAWRVMAGEGYGRVVLTSSSAAVFGRDAGSGYAAVKGALLGLGRSLALEGRECGIVVNTILPYAETGILRDNPLSGGELARRIQVALNGLYARGLPATDVAPLVSFLASPSCKSGGHTYWTCARRYSEVFSGLTRGWVAPSLGGVDAEDIRDHLVEIENSESFEVPLSIAEELEWVLQGSTPPPV